MSSTQFTVEGRIFRNLSDYKAALRDRDKIQKIRNEVDFTSENALQKLLSDVDSGVYHFETILGQDLYDDAFLAHKDIEKKKRDYEKLANKNKKEIVINHTKKKSKSKVNKKNASINRSKRKSSSDLSEIDDEMKQEILRQLKLREKRRRFFIFICAIVALCCLGYFNVYNRMAKESKAEADRLASLKGEPAVTEKEFTYVPTLSEEYIEESSLTILEEYETLYNLNKKLIGWIKIDDTIIDYPVLQTVDNEYYLKNNFNQEYDNNGSIFMDYHCDIVNRSTNLILYGHNMLSGKMFGTLKKYSSEDYYKEHSIIYFDTIYEKGTYEIIYVFRSKVYSEEDITFKYYQFFDVDSKEEFDSNMQEMHKMALYDTGITATYGDQLLTLSTCDSGISGSRFVVVAKRIG